MPVRLLLCGDKRMWIRVSMARKLVWVEDSSGSWMVRAVAMESSRSFRAQALDLLPPEQ